MPVKVMASKLNWPAAGFLFAGAVGPGCSLASPERLVSERPLLGSGCRSQWCWCTGRSARLHSAERNRKKKSRLIQCLSSDQLNLSTKMALAQLSGILGHLSYSRALLDCCMGKKANLWPGEATSCREVYNRGARTELKMEPEAEPTL